MVYNLARAVDRNAGRDPDGVALQCGNNRVTHFELQQMTRELAAGLRAHGIRPGDVVALLAGNSIEFVVSTLAINGAGAIFLPLNIRLAAEEWKFILSHSQAKALVVDANVVRDVSDLRAACAGLELIIGVGDARGADVAWTSLATGHRDDHTPFAVTDAADISRLMYTSGTTARPKGVQLSYGNVLWKIFDHVVEFGLTARDITLVAGPLYHVGGYDLPGIGVLYVGGRLVILPGFDPRAVMQAIEEHGVTNVWLAPSMLNGILQLDDSTAYDTSSLRFVTNGGEKMPISLIERFKQLFPTTWLADSFGMTESAAGDTVLGPADTITKLGSVGKPVLHVDVRIIDESDRDVPNGVSGELLLKGPKVFAGYLRDPEATERAFVDGWFRTGDIAHLDDDGYLFIDDRKKDMIVSGGENIASPEIERVLYQHPAVKEAAVVAMPDTRWGEVPKAVVALKAGHEASAEEIIEFCRAHLARFKVPRVVEFVAELPRTATGKVLKRELR